MSSGLIAWFVFVILLLGIVRFLAESPSRNVVTGWTTVGILVGVLKNNLFQLTSQWKDTPVDAVTYALNADALRLHWSGHAVDAVAYQLRGYTAGWDVLFGPAWTPDSAISFAGVLGTHEWGYAMFLALWGQTGDGWQSWAILANAAMCGSVVGCAYILALQLGLRARVAHLGALLVTVDPLLAVNGLWLLKDTLASLVTVIALIVCCRLVQRPSWRLTLGVATMLAFLGAVRFAPYCALYLALLVVGTGMMLGRQKKRASYVAFALALAAILFGVLYLAPNLPKLSTISNALISPVKAQVTTLHADSTESGFDESVQQWKEERVAEPLLIVVSRTIARTLLAPYPWVALTHGISGDNHIELYLPGMVMWVLCLPALFWGVWALARRPTLCILLLFVFLSAVTGAYIVFFGEWSTRQRVFLNPVLYLFAAIGWYALWDKASPLIRRRATI